MPYDDIGALPDYIRKKPESTQRRWMAVWNSAYSSCTKDGGSASECEASAFKQANGVIKGAEMADETPQHLAHHEGAWSMQLEKADSRVNYRTSEGETQCNSCRFYDAECMRCDLVEGAIDATWTCNLWTEQMTDSAPTALPPMYDYSEREHPFAVFVEASQQFAAGTDAATQWIPFLPKPGRYHHPSRGEILISREANQQLIDSVKNQVYQENIPLDAEHETKLSGAVAWLKDMRMNEDGSADAYVEWTDRGRKLVDSGQFKYISPEWFSIWSDPATGEVHKNVVAGGAITTRPFFKDRVLRALVASEHATDILVNSDAQPPQEEETKEKSMAEKDEQVETYTTAEVDAKIKEAVEAQSSTFTEQLTAQKAELESAQAAAASEKEARESLATELAAIKSRERHQRFTDMVMGRGGDGDGAPWAGDHATQIKLLEGLADKFSEDDEVFTSYVEQQKAVAVQLKESDLFKEIGSSASAMSDPERQLQSMVEARAREKSIPEHQAYAEVLGTKEGAALYEKVGVAKRAD